MKHFLVFFVLFNSPVCHPTNSRASVQDSLDLSWPVLHLPKGFLHETIRVDSGIVILKQV